MPRNFSASSDPAVDSKIHPAEKFASSSDSSADSKMHPAEKFAEVVVQSGKPVAKQDILQILDL